MTLTFEYYLKPNHHSRHRGERSLSSKHVHTQSSRPIEKVVGNHAYLISIIHVHTYWYPVFGWFCHLAISTDCLWYVDWSAGLSVQRFAIIRSQSRCLPSALHVHNTLLPPVLGKLLFKSNLL